MKKTFAIVAVVLMALVLVAGCAGTKTGAQSNANQPSGAPQAPSAPSGGAPSGGPAAPSGAPYG